jgi:hydroxyacylglutathione hydrolase
MPIERFVVGPMGNNTYVLHDARSKEAVIVDPSMDAGEVLEWVKEKGLTVNAVLNTHGHSDHVFSNALFVRETGAKLYIHQDDSEMLARLVQQGGWGGSTPEASPEPDGYLEDGLEIPIGSETIRVITTPGHTPGSSCFVLEDAVMTGDTLFQGSIGRFDFPGGNLADLISSIRTKLFEVLPAATRVLPGHNELSTIAEEKLSNPFVGERATVDLTKQLEQQ